MNLQDEMTHWWFTLNNVPSQIKWWWFLIPVVVLFMTGMVIGAVS